MEQENDSYLNEKQNQVSARKEGELFHPPKNYVLQKTRIEARDQLCQQHWFEDFPWIHYDERYMVFLI